MRVGVNAKTKQLFLSNPGLPSEKSSENQNIAKRCVYMLIAKSNPNMVKARVLSARFSAQWLARLIYRR